MHISLIGKKLFNLITAFKDLLSRMPSCQFNSMCIFFSGIANAKVTITTFGLLSKSTSNIVREALLSQGFQVTIVDESHYIRNVKTASAKIVVPLIKNANRRILLSGTPALARPVEVRV